MVQDAAWDGTVESARSLLPAMAGRVVARDGFVTPLRLVAGIQLLRETDGGLLHAAMVLLDAETLAPVASEVASAVLPEGHRAGLDTFDEVPAMLRALARLPQPPDLVLVAGLGIAHPLGFGVASHFGVLADIPTIGIADALQVGTAPEPHQVRGAYTAVREGTRQTGWLLRSRPGEPAVVVSTGHRVATASAADLVMRFVLADRMPEPLRLAAALGAPG